MAALRMSPLSRVSRPASWPNNVKIGRTRHLSNTLDYVDSIGSVLSRDIQLYICFQGTDSEHLHGVLEWS